MTMRVAVVLCLLACSSNAFLFDGFADGARNFFSSLAEGAKELGGNLLDVTKALGQTAVATAKGVFQEALTSGGLAVANSLQPIMNTSVNKREVSGDVMQFMSGIKSKLQKLTELLKQLVSSGSTAILSLKDKLAGKQMDKAQFTDEVKNVVADHQRQARSLFGDVLGQLIDYGKVLLNAIRGRVDKLADVVGLGKREAIMGEVEMKVAHALEGLAQGIRAGVEAAVKQSVTDLGEFVTEHADKIL